MGSGAMSSLTEDLKSDSHRRERGGDVEERLTVSAVDPNQDKRRLRKTPIHTTGYSTMIQLMMNMFIVGATVARLTTCL